MRLRLSLVLASIVCIAPESVALAQNAAPTPAPAQGAADNGSDNRAVAETLFFTGRGLMEAKRYAAACIKFAESYRLDPAAGTLLNLAVCHESEGKIASAWGEFRQALADAKKANRADREALAQEHVSKLEPELPFLAITVPANVKLPGLEVKRNGSVINPAAWDTELPVDPGKVEIVTTAPGYKPRTQTIDVQIKQHASIAIEPLEVAPLEVASVNYWSPKRKAGAALLGVGVASVGVGAVTGFVAVGQKKDSDAACPTQDGQLRCSQAGVDAMSKARTMAWVSDIGFGVGAVSLLVGGYLFFSATSTVEYRQGKDTVKADVKPSLGWNVVAGPNGAQGFVTGSF